MKQVPAYTIKESQKVDAYTNVDLAKLNSVFHRAGIAWVEEWRRQGARDEGSCCLGKGLQVWWCGPGKRTAIPRLVVRCDFVQGNVTAQRTKAPAEEILRAAGIHAWYNDGVMD